MKDRNLKIISGVISALLLISLIIKLTTTPGGLILSGLFLGGIKCFVPGQTLIKALVNNEQIIICPKQSSIECFLRDVNSNKSFKFTHTFTFFK